MKLLIYHLYPDLLDLYGDRGNIITLAARCRWRGIEAEVRTVSLGEELDFSQPDILFLGGGSDREQDILVGDLSSRSGQLKESIENGLVLLTICGGYQLLGQYFQTVDGKRIPGLGILDLYTVAGKRRLIGNIIAEMEPELTDEVRTVYNTDYGQGQPDIIETLVGFENHSGKTYLGKGLKPLAKVIRGYGNNGEDSWEGMRYKNVIGTYFHGPLLPKNPHLADLLLGLALRRKGVSKLSFLKDGIETAAHKAVIERFGKTS